MRSLTRTQVMQFMHEFPYLDQIPKFADSVRGQNKDIFDLSVQIADGSVLYAQPDFHLAPHYVTTRDSRYIGHIAPSCYVFGAGISAITSGAWDSDHQNFYVKDLLTTQAQTVLEAKYLVMVTRADLWHYLAGDFGGWSHHKWTVVVYKAPKQGFASLIETTNLSSNVRISDAFTFFSTAHSGHPEAKKALDTLKDMCQKIVSTIAPTIWEKAQESSALSCTIGGTSLLVFASGGSIVLTFERGSDTISFIGKDQKTAPDRIGTQSMNCTLDMAKDMIQEVISGQSKLSSMLKQDNAVFPNIF